MDVTEINASHFKVGKWNYFFFFHYLPAFIKLKILASKLGFRFAVSFGVCSDSQCFSKRPTKAQYSTHYSDW